MDELFHALFSFSQQTFRDIQDVLPDMAEKADESDPSKPAQVDRSPTGLAAENAKREEASTHHAIAEMATTLQEIQGILKALAEHSGTRLPRRTIDPQTWRPNEDAYDMQQTIDYILGTLPPPDMASQVLRNMQALWGENTGLDLLGNNSKRLDIELTGEGERSLFSWDVQSRERWENTAELSEYGYDGDGGLCLLGHYGRLERPDGLFPRLRNEAAKPPVVEHMVCALDNIPVIC